MVVKFENTFYKDIGKVKDKKLAADVKKAIVEFETAHSIREISNVKKLAGHKSAFRKRMGDYRIGFFVEENAIILTRFLLRKEIYRFFP